MHLRSLSLACCGLLLAATAWTATVAPVAVSPGSPERLVVIGDRCPSFSWGAADRAVSYELAVYRIGDAGDALPILSQTVPGSALSWTPPLEQCLEPGSRYAWSIRAVSRGKASEWSQPNLFRVARGPSEAELQEVLAVVERYFVQHEPEAPVEDALAAIPEAEPPDQAVADSAHSAALLSGVTIADDGVWIGAEAVVTTSTDSDTLAGLSCPDGQLAKWSDAESQWQCGDDSDTDTLAGLACPDGQLAKWNDSLAQWECAADTDTDTLAGLACPDGQLAKWNDSLAQWECAADIDTDTLAGLACPDGQLAKWNDSLAQWECAVDVDTDTLAGLACPDGQLAKWSDSLAQWVCAADIDTNTDTDTLAGLACPDGQVAKWSDSLAQWECAADQTADTAGLEEEICRLYLQTGQLPFPDFCDVEPVNGSVDITGQVVAQVDVNPITDRVYIGSNYSLSLQPLTVIDVSDKTNPTVVTTVTGSGATVNPATNRFYAKGGTGFSGTFLVYNGVDNSLITTVPIGYCGGRLDTDATTNMIYMTSECGAGNDPLHVLNGATNTLAAGPLQTGGIVGTVVVNSTTGNAYVARTGGTRVFGPPPGFALITDLAGISCGAVNPVTNRIYCGSSGNLEVRSGVDHSLITTIAGVADTIGVNTARDRIYVNDGPAQLIRVVDGATNTVIGDISLGAGVTPGPGAVDSTKNRLYVSGFSPGPRLYVVTDTVP